ncbi:ATPase component BioM of energizing module of biotin ECF transporter [Pseudonocardia sp. Ae168_Ps1]|uniref:energy-coupling factor ABC transporter ATP-binding protein n=1 Tax=unclassified Pseudonocardia TaxID=2619320 RepID=UPI00094B139B|nr:MULTISPECIES: ABC transporter ATP-binding protein [unclassified Pseudonocardia]OLL75194.1 ATPase component BioM of energizing module of biotin ECF transporter [Pseudonocardia sp. Ae150A_Ps1]OLL81188.1 ATPase component BioM of energizing module of biotin ECF transporter [Pseudonocardia sp. Ae168_Ps1]OLL84697.1 ATPase component BioM of energizing module of biotin ECF transporter [Pseudonocardia sp. Ae263_Ps1]OLL95286.1 ATPase component BioM of energizing module of biotin ECF transporter [Pseud
MIEFDGIGHRYGERVVLDGVDLTLPQQRVALVGANGSGKSTLARTVNGLVRPTAGSVRVDGRDPARHGSAVRRRVGFVFSDPDSQIVMPTAGEDVAFSLRRTVRNRAERTRLAAEKLTEFGLGDHVEHPAHQLSGGQKQLLALCAVLVLDPDVLVCDEPTTLLDLRNKRAFAERLAGLRQQVLLATHDLDLLDGFDRVIVLDGGRVVADDEPGPAVAYYRKICAE